MIFVRITLRAIPRTYVRENAVLAFPIRAGKTLDTVFHNPASFFLFAAAYAAEVLRLLRLLLNCRSTSPCLPCLTTRFFLLTGVCLLKRSGFNQKLLQPFERLAFVLE